MPTKKRRLKTRGRPRVTPETTLGRFLRTARLKRGLALEQFADLAGVSAQTASHWERGTKAPAQEQVTTLLRSCVLSTSIN